MTPIQQLLLGAGGAKKKTYMDDVFSTYVYKGTGSSLAVNNGIDLAGEGGMTWFKRRNATGNHNLIDTIRGKTKVIFSENNNAQATEASYLTSFNNNGFTIGTDSGLNATNKYTSWTFRKAPGFFDVVTWTGNSDTNQTISHGLQAIPGCIMAKRTDAAGDWTVYHQGLADSTQNNSLKLNDTDTANNDNNWQEITSTSFRAYDDINYENGTYVAYIFAGADTVRWSDKLTYSSGTEENGFFASRAFDGQLQSTPNRLMTTGNYITVTMTINPAITVKSGESVIVYGEDAAIGNPYSYNSTATATIAGTTYTSSSGDTHTFTHSGALTQITLRTNSTGGRTILEGIKVNGKFLKDGDFFISGDPHATSTQSVFGEGGDKDIIKCGNYIGTNGIDIEVELGWEPQWVLIKSTETASNWILFDSIRGVYTDENDNYLYANLTNTEYTEADRLELMSTGFKILGTTWTSLSTNGEKYVYMAIRRPDGYVGKPAAAATDVFATDIPPNPNSAAEGFISGFITDYALYTAPNATADRFTNARLTGTKALQTNKDVQAESSDSDRNWDIMNGFGTDQSVSKRAFMWKRHKGFDVVAYKGCGTARKIKHGLNSTPGMIWVKKTDGSDNWAIYHSGANGGTNPAHYFFELNTTEGENDNATFWNDTAPTSSVFSLGTTTEVNENNKKYTAVLFSSVDGISKVGRYAGTGSTQTIQTGFQPTFLIVKRADGSDDWHMVSTAYSWEAGNDQSIRLSNTSAEGVDCGQPNSSDGFDLPAGGEVNVNNQEYIYYAHA